MPSVGEVRAGDSLSECGWAEDRGLLPVSSTSVLTGIARNTNFPRPVLAVAERRRGEMTDKNKLHKSMADRTLVPAQLSDSTGQELTALPSSSAVCGGSLQLRHTALRVFTRNASFHARPAGASFNKAVRTGWTCAGAATHYSSKGRDSE